MCISTQCSRVIFSNSQVNSIKWKTKRSTLSMKCVLMSIKIESIWKNFSKNTILLMIPNSKWRSSRNSWNPLILHLSARRLNTYLTNSTMIKTTIFPLKNSQNGCQTTMSSWAPNCQHTKARLLLGIYTSFKCVFFIISFLFLLQQIKHLKWNCPRSEFSCRLTTDTKLIASKIRWIFRFDEQHREHELK